VNWISTIISALLAGLIIGPLARLAIPGKQNISLIGTILSGAVGSLAGSFLANVLGVGETSGIDWIQLGLSVAAGALAVVGYIALTKK